MAQPQAELTLKALILGIVLSVILSAANTYLGLFAGMTVSASIPAAVISMGIFRMFRNSTILENNLVQTAASAGESVSAGIIFTIPALVIMNYWETFNYWWVTIIAALGGLLGVLFTIPLRRSLIVESDLKFPEGVATAEVLTTGQQGGKEIWYIVQASIVGAVFKLGQAGLNLMTDAIFYTKAAGSAVFKIGTNLSPALISVGYIVGLNIAVLIFLGGALNWMVAIPICTSLDSVIDMLPKDLDLTALRTPEKAPEFAKLIWATFTRYIGVGGMVVGGIWTIFKMRNSLLGGITSGLKAYRKDDSGQSQSQDIPSEEKDMPMNWVLFLILGSIVPIFLLYQNATGHLTISLTMSIIMVIAGFVFSAVAGYMAGLVGSSNNPISGITIATVLFSSLLLLLMGLSTETNGPVAAIIIGAVVCCAAAIAGDNMQDLKAGHILKATPWKQQVMQMVGTVSAAFFIAPILNLMLKAYGFAGHSSAQANPLAAPQATLMQSVADGVFARNLPWAFIAIGAIIAVLVIILDEILILRKSSFRTPVLAVSIGIYLPFELSVPILIGGIIQFFASRFIKRNNYSSTDAEAANRHGLLFASGLITGEALMGILLAIPIVIMNKDKPLKIMDNPKEWPGLILLAIVLVWLYVTAIRKAHNNNKAG